MLHEFLTSNREELISRCRMKVAQRSAPKPTERELQYGIPVFLSQLVNILHTEAGLSVEGVPFVPSDATVATMGIEKTAILHGNELLLAGFTVNQVVRDYGDLCQAITELAIEAKAAFTTAEFRSLNRCLDNAIASAVSQYARKRDQSGTDESARTTNGSLTIFEQQLNLINRAIVAMDAIKSGNVGIAGATGGVLDRSLKFLQDLTVRALADDQLREDIPIAPAE